MFILIGLFGSQTRKVRAAYMFLLYTVAFSFFMLYGLAFLFATFGTTFSLYLVGSTSLLLESAQRALWLCFFLAFAAKIPMIPFHL